MTRRRPGQHLEPCTIAKISKSLHKIKPTLSQIPSSAVYLYDKKYVLQHGVDTACQIQNIIQLQILYCKYKTANFNNVNIEFAMLYLQYKYLNSVSIPT